MANRTWLHFHGAVLSGVCFNIAVWDPSAQFKINNLEKGCSQSSMFCGIPVQV